MKNVDFRVWIGAALVLLGGLMIAEKFGLFHAAIDVFWGIVFMAGAAYFLLQFISNPRGRWWAAIPGFALAGLATESLLPRSLGNLHGLPFLGALGVAFFAVYLSGRERWWAIIPGGTLITLGVIAAVSNGVRGEQTTGLLFIGLGVTFLLVAVLASMQWAYIPGVVLLALGGLLGTVFAGAFEFLWPAALVLAGLFLVIQFVRKR